MNQVSPSDELYRNYRFRVKWGGRYVAGFAEVSPLPQNLKCTDTLPGGYPPAAIGPEGQCTPFFINLERGTSRDLGFEQWISMVRNFGPATGKGSLLTEYKRPFTIEIYLENGTIESTYRFTHCWVTEYTAIPSPDGHSHETSIEHLRLGFDRWKRDPPDDK